MTSFDECDKWLSLRSRQIVEGVEHGRQPTWRGHAILIGEQDDRSRRLLGSSIASCPIFSICPIDETNTRVTDDNIYGLIARAFFTTRISVSKLCLF